jgi:hypothetical protein
VDEIRLQVKAPLIQRGFYFEERIEVAAVIWIILLISRIIEFFGKNNGIH